MNFYKFLQISITLLFCAFIPLGAEGAILYLEPAEGEYYQGDTFIAEVRIDPEEECINTVQADLTFLKDVLEVEDLSAGNSIISVWIKNPEYSNETGLISFAGGIPGGYCGQMPGDPEKSNLLGRIVFQVRETDTKLIHETEAKLEFLESSRVLLNDGLGTPAELTTRGAVIEVRLPEEVGLPKIDEWQEELESDKISPEPFEIEISQDPLTFEGKYFIVFSTTDKQTGIDYYEVKEGKGDWKRAQSPYLLKDQGLKGIITVKAIDKAGNERIAEYIPPKKPFPYWMVIVVLAVVGVIWWIITKLKRNQTRN